MENIEKIKNFLIFAMQKMSLTNSDTKIDIMEISPEKLKIRFYNYYNFEMFYDIDYDDNWKSYRCYVTIINSGCSSLMSFEMLLDQIKTIKNCINWGLYNV